MIVFHDGCGHELGLFTGARWSRFEIFQGGKIFIKFVSIILQAIFRKLTLLLLYLHSDVVVDGEYYEVGNNVEDAHSVEDSRVIEWDLLRYLHHTQDDG